jgi:hypothetical protein
MREGSFMSVATLEGAESIMTDKQFDSIIELVIQILSRASDLEDAKKALQAVKRGSGSEEKKESK